MDELVMAKNRYEALMDRMVQDMEVAEKYKADLAERYKANMPLEALVTIQSQVLRIQDYITQKFNNYVEIQRGYEEIVKAIDEAE
jgi:ribosomal protein S17E